LLLACNSQIKDNNKNCNFVSFGLYCGECHGKCFQGYYFKNDTVYKIALSYGSDIESINIDTLKDKIILDKKDSKKINSILNLLPENIDQEKEKIGNPDDHDQCGIEVFKQSKNNKKRIFIDTDKSKCPKKYHDFIDAVVSLNLL